MVYTKSGEQKYAQKVGEKSPQNCGRARKFVVPLLGRLIPLIHMKEYFYAVALSSYFILSILY